MKKKMLSVLWAALLVFCLAACGNSGTGNRENDTNNGSLTDNEGSVSGTGGYELALITDVGTIDDKSFNQGSWEGLSAYAKEHNITCRYYKPVEASDEAYRDAAALAVKGGAKLIVLPGYLFETACFELQTQYPNVAFILLDGKPHDAGYHYNTESNTLAIQFAEEQAGYLAGYAAVTDGYRKLGFMGGIAIPSVVRFGYGFIQGANAAAEELGLDDGAVEMKYTYLGSFDPSPDYNTKAAAWYAEGTEVIFAAAGAAGNSVMQAAETSGAVMIGVDVDQSSESEAVISSAMKNLQKAVYDAVASYYDGTFEGGREILLDAANDGVRLPMETSRWNTFEQAKYSEVYARLQGGTVNILTDTDVEEPSKINAPKMKVMVY